MKESLNVMRLCHVDQDALALVSIGRYLGMFDDRVKVKAVYGISEEPMSAEEWKKQYVREG
jgi:hypothetical protein